MEEKLSGFSSHAFLIVAHGQKELLCGLIESLMSSRSNIYVHIDARNKILFEEIKVKYATYDNIKVYSEIKVLYGGIGIMDAQMFLLRIALQNPENERFHQISGQDMLCKPLDQLFAFFDTEDNKDRQFIKYMKLPDYQRYPKGGGVDRFSYYYVYDVLNNRAKGPIGLIYRGMNRCLLYCQKIIGFKRKPMFEQMYKGSNWMSINRDGANAIITKIYDKDSRHYMRFNMYCDEVYPISIINNTPSLNVVNDDLRYVDWTRKSSKSSPAILDMRDKDKILASNKFFARKVDENISAELLDWFKSNVTMN